jgi:predicted phage-related endonuclease
MSPRRLHLRRCATAAVVLAYELAEGAHLDPSACCALCVVRERTGTDGKLGPAAQGPRAALSFDVRHRAPLQPRRDPGCAVDLPVALVGRRAPRCRPTGRAMTGLLPEHAKLRMSGIGSSDIADIVLRSGLRTWCDKMGIVREERPKSLQGRQPATWGTRLEASVCDAYAEEMGVEVYKPDPPVFYLPGTIALASPDRLVRLPSEKKRGLEAKTANRWMEREWELVDEDADDERGVPERFVIQCEWLMGVTGIPRWDVAVLLDAQDFRIRHLTAHPERFAGLLAIAEHFWRTYVIPRRQPDADGSDEWKDYLARRYPHETKKLVRTATAADFDNADRARRWAQIEKRAAEKKETHRARLKASCGEAEGIEGVCTWTTTKKGRQLRLAKED